jgi:hypothetical protein
MSDDAIDRVTERLRAGRAARAGSDLTPAASAHAAALRGSQAFPVGARVFDVQLGQDGTIVAPPPGTVSLGKVVYVRFDSGVTNARLPNNLIVRPTPPAPRS